MPDWIVGIDEAGRGPLAGPVAVGLVLLPVTFDWRCLEGVGDSKAISAPKRERLYQAALLAAARGELYSTVELMSAAQIDTAGIAVVIRAAIEKGLASLLAAASLTPAHVSVRLDGSLSAPAVYLHQETIIKGDAKEPVIGLASIMAKVTRDAYMVARGREVNYHQYDFARHKGYGTARHRRLIAEHGLSPEHRRSYCKNIKVL